MKTITIDVIVYRRTYRAGPQVYRTANALCWVTDRLWDHDRRYPNVAEVAR